MQTDVKVDNDLVAEAMRMFGATTESDAVRSAVKVGILRQAAILDLWGIGWEGDLEEMRLDKPRPSID